MKHCGIGILGGNLEHGESGWDRYWLAAVKTDNSTVMALAFFAHLFLIRHFPERSGVVGAREYSVERSMSSPCG